jgi:hypothetical protein
VEFNIDTPPDFKQVLWAWNCLEDADRVAQREKDATQQWLHIERYLCLAAVSLRSAMDARFNDFHKVPDQEMMAFVTAARHTSAHASSGTAHSRARNLQLGWNQAADEGYVEAEIVISLNTKEAKLSSPQLRDGALRYLNRRNGDFYRALHDATRQAAAWCNVQLNDDFERLGQATVGIVKIKIPVKDKATMNEMLRTVSTGYGEVMLGPINSDAAPKSP